MIYYKLNELMIINNVLQMDIYSIMCVYLFIFCMEVNVLSKNINLNFLIIFLHDRKNYVKNDIKR